MEEDPRARQQDVARSLGDSAAAGGLLGVLIAAAAFVAARLGRVVRRRRR